MQNKLSYYDSLDVEKNSTFEEIRKSYVALALKWHPDKNLIGKKRAEKAFIEISEAYAVLSDPELKATYDSEGDKVLEVCSKNDLANLKLEDALLIFNSVYCNRDTVSACLEDANWYKNSEIFMGGLIKQNSNERFRGRPDMETEVIETSMSRYTRSPRNIEKTVKTVMIEKGGRRVKKTITTVNRADGTQEIIEEEKEEPINRTVVKTT